MRPHLARPQGVIPLDQPAYDAFLHWLPHASRFSDPDLAGLGWSNLFWTTTARRDTGEPDANWLVVCLQRGPDALDVPCEWPEGVKFQRAPEEVEALFTQQTGLEPLGAEQVEPAVKRVREDRLPPPVDLQKLRRTAEAEKRLRQGKRL